MRHCPHENGEDTVDGLTGTTPMMCCRCGHTWKVSFTLEKVRMSQHGPYLTKMVKSYKDYDLDVQCVDETKLDLAPKLGLVPRRPGKETLPTTPPDVVIAVSADDVPIDIVPEKK